ncbi:hypothetical protein CcCBS67573_g10155 [Chytriomyces confervae]|uniref:Expansin-like EG45 domain-containing protein n=1 Tax=Chytriomyces confervae TaxID=246404 RepID=A0A507DD93_9FUNG|nr:hypothetical protein CcCBS67573_g10155 [Chytriomyces confervae]
MSIPPPGSLFPSGSSSATITWFGDTWQSPNGRIILDGQDIGGTACGAGVPPASATLYGAVSDKSLTDITSIVNSGLCGQCMRISSSKGSTIITIVDVMLNPDAQPNDIDLSTGAFDAVANVADGKVSGIQWEWVACDGSSTPPSPITTAAAASTTTISSDSTDPTVSASLTSASPAPATTAAGTTASAASPATVTVRPSAPATMPLFESSAMVLGTSLCAIVLALLV